MAISFFPSIHRRIHYLIFSILLDIISAHASDHVRARMIHKTWAKMYGLESKDKPPLNVIFPDHPKFLRGYPWAPHLQPCREITEELTKSEEYWLDGTPPDWTHPHGSQGPSPPWVKGGDDENLSLTRHVQTDIWLHQFPANCSQSNLKFLVMDWVPNEGFGLGSQIHIMTVALSLAMTHKRILVPASGMFERAKHEGCQGETYGSLNCYFSSTTSRECETVANRRLEAGGYVVEGKAELQPALASTHEVIHVKFPFDLPFDTGIASYWGSPWQDSPESVEVFGEIPDQGDAVRKVSWWRAQAVRFLLRWPSAYLCHQLNIARHEAYGSDVASSHSMRLRVLNATIDGLVAGVDFKRRSLENNLWKLKDSFVPRPIVSVHVRQGDKQIEMDLFQFSSYVWLAERLKFHVPTLKYMWLSTEMQSVVEEASQYHGWRVYYTENPRQKANIPLHEYEKKSGMRTITDISFVNLVIASECDYFVGVLGSNWSRLLNELRLTSGKLKQAFLTVNVDEV